jgi:2-polyprenyl-3-methyl-5-hydroxy-6-metoxy-1,4-benzoquinol methylase
MIENIKGHLKEYFENETYLDRENGYPERDAIWMKENLVPRIKNNITDLNQKNCLDVGCAFGYFTRVLGEEFKNTYGIDLSDTRINYAKQYETDNLKFIQSDLTESFQDKFPIKFDYMFTNAVLPHIPAPFKASVFSNLAQVANSGCIFTLYDGMINQSIKDSDHDNYIDNDFDNWDPNTVIKVTFFSKEWLQDNLVEWELVEINNVGYYTEEIILRKK